MELKPYFESSYGTTLRTIEAAGIRLSELAYPPDFRTPKHSHEAHRIIVRLRGNSIQTHGNRTVTRIPSTVGFYCPGDIHSDHFLPPGARNLNIEFSPGHNLSSLRNWLETPNRSFVVNDPALRCLCPKLYNEFRQPDELSALAIEGLVMELVAWLFRGNIGNSSEKQPPCWLQQAEGLIHNRYAERLTLAEISRAVGVHPVHLARRFRKFYKCSIGEYVRRLRIEFAMEQISKTRRSLSELALAAGFSDQSHFSRTFRKLAGVTPRQFKEMSR